MIALFIFRRDLRLEDNTALLKALEESENVIPAFFLDPRQLKNNDYFSENAYEFMIDSLKELDVELKRKGSKLYLFEAKPEEVIKDLGVGSVYLNKDYTPFSKERDEKIKKVCEEENIGFKSYHDLLLNEPGKVLKDDGKPYTVFTHYFNKAVRNKVKKPVKNNYSNYYKGEIKNTVSLPSVESNPDLFVKGGRKEALDILKKNLLRYDEERDYPSVKGTTGLSAHHKFGTISIRESYEAFKDVHALKRELYFRDFFTYIAHHHPWVFGKPFHKKYEKIKWEKEHFDKWKKGMTGYPIVDAGMRELNKTGYMHNRVRMITASFLTKHLLIDWREGEKYFASKLVDYDPCVNNGNWQWASSTGCDAQPYFRIFNPWRQQERFDKDCRYIKKWVPELKRLTAKEIHNLKDQPIKEYPEPVVEHETARKRALERYKII